MTRYGIEYADGGYTGGITESQRDAQHYAREYRGTVYVAGGPDDPERRVAVPAQVEVNIWRAP